jgi:hypothetical protein
MTDGFISYCQAGDCVLVHGGDRSRVWLAFNVPTRVARS